MPRLSSRHPPHYEAIADEVLQTEEGKRALGLVRACGIPIEYDLMTAQHWVPRWGKTLVLGWPYGRRYLTSVVDRALRISATSPERAEEFVLAVRSIADLGGNQGPSKLIEFMDNYTEWATK
jgi:hypothetical protein